MLKNLEETVPLRTAAMAGELPAEQNYGRAWKGLLWSEWYAHSQVLLIFLAVWLLAVWTLPLFTHPGWILILGGLYALMAGPMYGGADILEGCEEFTFALPPTRAERFFSRLIVGLGTLLFLCFMNVVALGLDLPQILARLYVQTGIIKPLPVIKPGLLYGLVVALPVAVFAIAFTISTVTHSRILILLSWFWAGVAALAALQVGFWYENLVWDTLNGYFACPLLIAVSGAVLGYGYRSFRQKEVGKATIPITLPGHWWIWTILFAIGMGLALVLVTSLLRHLPQFVQ
jgi:hypothetical protein